jgi:hypothetical protein
MPEKLLFADCLRVMETERLLPERQKLMVKAERYFFETYGDVDEDTVRAIFDTAQEMIEYGLFHLPHPLIWLEDPWPANWMDEAERLTGMSPPATLGHARGRQLYLLQEHEDRIVIELITASSLPGRPSDFRYQLFTIPTVISLKPGDAADWRAEIGTSAIAVKQFVVTLATAQAAQERRVSGGYGGSVPKARRSLPYTDVRIVVPQAGPSGGAGLGSGDGHHARRKYHLVAGYMWGKHTRPREAQRWVAPFWRGDAALGVAGHDHYEVRRRAAAGEKT